jgi:hypothetical protein
LITPEIDPHPDLAATAQARGWTLDEAAAQQRAADAVGAIATRIAKKHPDIFVGSALSTKPGGAPTLYIKGPANAFVSDQVASSDVQIVLADRQPYSFLELEARQLEVHKSLAAAGYRNIVSGTNITGRGLIPATVAVEPGLAAASGAILAAVPSPLRSSVALTVTDPSAFADTGAWAGMWVRKNGANDSTSGWTVRRLEGGSWVYGVTTAGHAVNSGQTIVHPGHATHSFVYKSQHRGQWGDVQWHITNTVEEALFYAETTTLRNVLYLEARSGISVNESVCQYGRASDFRDCDLDVHDVSISCTLSGVFNNRLVQMDAITSTFGDSGGPWFYDYKAYGSQKGHCASRDAWSVADLYDEALGVQFVIYE